VPSLKDIHDTFSAWMAFTDDERRFDPIDIALATIVANRMDGDPVWTFLVAPPSGGKTEIIRSFNDVPDTFPLSSLTPQTFASGFERKGGETSLLPRLDGKTVTLKDFGTVLTMYHDARAEILAQLREIYDGSFTKEWGNGKSFKWSGKVGMLAGCTPIIDQPGVSALSAALGERFIIYRLKTPPARSLARRAIAQQTAMVADLRNTLREIVAQFLDTLLPVSPPMPAEVAEGLAALAEYTSIARSPVKWNDRRDEIEFVPPPEAPGRLAKQLALLARALAVVRGEHEVSLSTYITVHQVAQDTPPATRSTMLKAVVEPGQSGPIETKAVALATRYPTHTARRYLQELAVLQLVERISEGQGYADRWAPSTYMLELLDAMKRPIDGLSLYSESTA